MRISFCFTRKIIIYFVKSDKVNVGIQVLCPYQKKDGGVASEKCAYYHRGNTKKS